MSSLSLYVHLTVLSSPHENKYGCRALNAKPLTDDMCPVRVIFSVPEARSQS